MKSKDYRCINCENIDEIWIKDTEQFKDKEKCSQCKSISKKMFSIVGCIFPQGSCGNAKNGYESTGGNIKKS